MAQANFSKQRKDLEDEMAALQARVSELSAVKPAVPDAALLSEITQLRGAVMKVESEKAALQLQCVSLQEEVAETARALAAAVAEVARLQGRVDGLVAQAAVEGVGAATAQSELRRQLGEERAAAEALRVRTQELMDEVSRLGTAVYTAQAGAVKGAPTLTLTHTQAVSVLAVPPPPPLDVEAGVGAAFPPLMPSVRARGVTGASASAPPLPEEEDKSRRAPLLLHSDLLLKACINDPAGFARSQTGITCLYVLALHVAILLLLRRC